MSFREVKDTDARYDIFLSYSSHDHAAVEPVAKFLHHQGLKPFLDRWYLPAGQPWQTILEQVLSECRSVAVFLGPGEMGSWQQREKEVALDRQAHEKDFPVIPVLLPGSEPLLGFLSQSTWVDLRGGVDDQQALSLLARAIVAEPAGPSETNSSGVSSASICPYRGLSYFREEDAPFFVGREAVSDRLAEAAPNRSLIAVIGASGSGKSSVARAGLLPRLRLSDGITFEMATMFPGDRPLHALAGALLPALEPEKWLAAEIDELALLHRKKELAELLASDLNALRDIAERVVERQAGTDRLLILVDQWEELYTLTHRPGDTEKFIDALLHATVHAPLTVVLTLRGDFYGRALEHSGLSDRLQDNVFNLRSMNREELKRAIESPARAVGLRFEAGLVERILDDVGAEPGNLPLLEFVLRELWVNRRGGTMYHAIYQRMGGVKGAMGGRAEAVYQRLKTSGRGSDALLEGLFLKLVKTSDGFCARQRVAIAELDQQERQVIEALAKERLLVTSGDPASHQETVEIAHEALIQHWGTLRGWLEQNRDFLAWRARLLVVAYAWEQHRDAAWLLRGRAISEAKRWLVSKQVALSQHAKDFIAASIRARQRRRWYLACAVLGSIALAVWGVPNILTINVYYPEPTTESPADKIIETTTSAKLTIGLVLIQPGRFQMGSEPVGVLDDSGDVTRPLGKGHTVTISEAFTIGTHEVTFHAYDLFAGATDRSLPDDQGWGRGNRPVINVSWEDAQAYANWLSEQTGRTFRLPTEAEWEYSARAGTTTRYWWGNDVRKDQQVCANCDGCGSEWDNEKTAPSGSFAPNPWGLYDVAGNLWEWVEDCWHDTNEGVPADGIAWLGGAGGDCSRHVIRGGSWNNPPRLISSTARSGWPAETSGERSKDKGIAVGFRVVSEEY